MCGDCCPQLGAMFLKGEGMGEILVISDVHLKDCSDARGKLFLELLAELRGARIKQFVLLGDIFDFCFGGSKYFREKFKPIGDALSEIAQSGIEVLVFEGNHEFALKQLGWAGVKFVGRKPLRIALSSGQQVLLAHGDLIAPSWHYKLYAWLTRTRVVCFVASLFPQKLFDRLCLGLSSLSKQRNLQRAPNSRRIVAAIDQWARPFEVEHVLVGHFHCPFHSKRKYGCGFIWCLESWDQPNALYLGERGIRRLKLGAQGQKLSFATPRSE